LTRPEINVKSKNYNKKDVGPKLFLIFVFCIDKKVIRESDE